jgi:hypothetical protein
MCEAKKRYKTIMQISKKTKKCKFGAGEREKKTI